MRENQSHSTANKKAHRYFTVGSIAIPGTGGFSAAPRSHRENDRKRQGRQYQNPDVDLAQIHDGIFRIHIC
jgi:hypothetical protein